MKRGENSLFERLDGFGICDAIRCLLMIFFSACPEMMAWFMLHFQYVVSLTRLQVLGMKGIFLSRHN